MDDLVKAALKKWPSVPHCYGWLALDARGDWYMRDERIQDSGPFPRVKGSRILHEKLREFIERNYEYDDEGSWFFQNGPQRVYVQLEAAPWIWRVDDEAKLTSHTGRAAAWRSGWLDEQGRLFADADIGFGLVHTQDMGRAARPVERGEWPVTTLAFAEMPARFGYRLDPRR